MWALQLCRWQFFICGIISHAWCFVVSQQRLYECRKMVPGQWNASKSVQVPAYDHIPQRGWCKYCYAANWWQHLLKPEPQVKVPGVMLDSKLNFNHHVSAICTKAARQLNSLTRISRFLSTSSRMIICNSFINSSFNYCPIVWHFCGKNNGDKI